MNLQLLSGCGGRGVGYDCFKISDAAAGLGLSDAWPGVTDPPAVRLFCFPFAGGSCTALRSWIARLPPEIESWGAEYPGRGRRWSETPCNSIGELVEEFIAAIALTSDRPFALFGYSFGALVAFELALALRDRQRLTPLCLVVASARAPHLTATGQLMYRLSDSDLIQQLRLLEGTPPEILANAGLMELLLPAIRADLRAYETYRYSPCAPLQCPIIVVRGADDRLVGPDQAHAWSVYGQRSLFKLHVLPGGHFLHKSAEAELLKILLSALMGGDPGDAAVPWNRV